jgi:murein L,D-transpeptidase YcbB/YkuD
MAVAFILIWQIKCQNNRAVKRVPNLKNSVLAPLKKYRRGGNSWLSLRLGKGIYVSDRDDPAAADIIAQLTDQRAVNLQLQATIDRLRGELENAGALTAAAVQRAQQGFSDEITQLKATAAALREAMEAQGSAAAASEQAVRATAETELGQLRAAVNALRTELEHERQRGEAAAVAAAAAAQQERATLHDQIQALRSKLETVA